MIETTLEALEVSLFSAEAGDVPAGDSWLSEDERLVLEGLTVAKRRRDWRLGRWVARQAVARALADPGAAVPAALSIVAADDGAPEVWWATPRPPVAVSISHSGDLGFAAAAAGRAPLGCDVERIAPRSQRFVDDYFTERERAFVDAAGAAGAQALAWAATLVWSAKESALKALRQGLRADTRSVEMGPVPEIPDLSRRGWRPLTVETAREARLEGHWRVADGAVWTVLADRPITLR
jgi:4'-phosphopantetheinyl transferase